MATDNNNRDDDGTCYTFWTGNRVTSGIVALVLLAIAWVWVGFPVAFLDLIILVFALGCVWIPDTMQKCRWKIGQEVAPVAVMLMGWLMLFFPLAIHLLQRYAASK